MAASPTMMPKPIGAASRSLQLSCPDEERELKFGQIWTDRTKRNLPSIVTDAGRRKSSVQFNTLEAEDTKRKESIPRQKPTDKQRRMSSPPPPSTYQRGVSFDTFANTSASSEAFTLNYKHRDYEHTARSRTFLCGTDTNDYSEYALEWMLDELVDDGDEIVCLRVVEEDSNLARSRKMDHDKPHDARAEKEKPKYRVESEKLLESVVRKNTVEEKAISMVMELAVGKVQDIFQQMVCILLLQIIVKANEVQILLYEPSALIVGTRGRNLGGMQGLLPGSVSKYCLQHSPIPVIVVRPSSKRQKKKAKRQQEMGRSLYGTMLEKAQTVGARTLYNNSSEDSVLPGATEQEAQAVSNAIGAPKGILKNRRWGGPLERVTSAKTDATSDDDEPSPQRFALPIGYLATESAPRADVAMQNPMIAALDEDWDDVIRSKDTTAAAGPRRKSVDRTSEAGASAISDVDDDLDGVPTIVDERRPSTRQSVPWLDQILSDKGKRSASHNRSRSR